MPNHQESRAGHIREHRSLLARAEKQTLLRVASRLPRWINSDHLSAIGFMAMLGAGAAFAVYPRTAWAALAVVVFLAINWLGDSLDGTLARYRKHERPRYGYYVDHVIDIAGTAALLAGLSVSELMSPVLAMALLGVYVAVCAETYLATHSLGVFRMAVLGFGPTELRLLLAVGAVKASVSPVVIVPLLDDVRLFDLGGAIATAALVLVFLYSATRNIRTLYLAEPIPSGANGANANTGGFKATAHSKG